MPAVHQRLDQYAKVRSKVTIREDGCWVDWRGSVNDGDQPVMWLGGRTQAVRTWLKRYFGVLHPMPCDTRGCLSPLHDVNVRE